MHFSISDSVARSSSTCPCQQHQGAGSDSGALWAGTSLHALACGFLLWGSGQVQPAPFSQRARFPAAAPEILGKRRCLCKSEWNSAHLETNANSSDLADAKTTANMKARRDFSVRPSMKWKAELEAQKCSHLHQKIQQNIAKSSLLLAVRNYVAWVLTTSVSLALGHPVLHVQLPRSWAEPASLMQSCQASWQLACHRYSTSNRLCGGHLSFENWQSTHPVLVEIARAPAQSQYSGPPAVSWTRSFGWASRYHRRQKKPTKYSSSCRHGFSAGGSTALNGSLKVSLPTVKNSRRGHLTLPCSCSNLWHNRCNLSSLVTELLRWNTSKHDFVRCLSALHADINRNIPISKFAMLQSWVSAGCKDVLRTFVWCATGFFRQCNDVCN